MRWLLPAAAVVVAVVVVRSGGGPPADTPGRKVVQMKDNFFSPKDITISRGDTILWWNAGSAEHTTTSRTPGNLDGLWNSGSPSSTWLKPGQSFQRVFNDTTGTFDYFYIPHAALQMFGTVTVDPQSLRGGIASGKRSAMSSGREGS